MPRRGVFWFLLAALVLLMPVACGLGTVTIPYPDVTRTLWREIRGLGHLSDPVYRTILMDVRLPRVLLVALVGGALALCGAVMQATFKNPLADPGLLGVSAGGALGAVLAIYTGLSAQAVWALPLLAFVGAMLATFTVLGVANLGGQATTTSLLLTGVAIGSFCVALMSLVLLKAEEAQVRQILFWLAGGAEARTWEHLYTGMAPMVVGGGLLLSLHRPLDVLLLGDEHALSVGVAVRRLRFWLLVLTSLTAGAAVSVCGAVGFVGLVTPHILRLVTGPSARRLLPCCVVGGAVFLVAADLASRLLSRQTEIPVGILTSLVGVPFFLWLLVRSRQEAW